MKIHTRPSSKVVVVTLNTTDGKRTVSTGTTDPKLARQLIKANNLATIEYLALSGNLTQNLIHKLTIGGVLSLDKVIAEWEEWARNTCGSERSADNSIYFARAWARDMRLLNERICDIKERHISEWINRVDAGKLGTRRVKLAAIHSLFRFCTIRGYSNDPSRLVKIKAKGLSHAQKEPRIKECLSDGEINMLVKHLLEIMESKPITDYDHERINTARFWYCATIIGRYAGLRLGDICSLEWDCLKQPGRMIVWTDKRDARVSLEIGDELAKGISSIPANKRKFCFPQQDGIIRNPNERSNLSVQFMRLLKKCDIKGKSFHSLRHSYASECFRRGIPTPHIAKSLGHSSTTTTDVYIHK